MNNIINELNRYHNLKFRKIIHRIDKDETELVVNIINYMELYDCKKYNKILYVLLLGKGYFKIFKYLLEESKTNDVIKIVNIDENLYENLSLSTQIYNEIYDYVIIMGRTVNYDMYVVIFEIIDKLIDIYDIKLIDIPLKINYYELIHYIIENRNDVSYDMMNIKTYHDIILKILNKNDNYGWQYINNNEIVGKNFIYYTILYIKFDMNNIDFISTFIDKIEDYIFINFKCNRDDINIKNHYYTTVGQIYYKMFYHIRSYNSYDIINGVFYDDIETKNMLKIINMIKDKIDNTLNNDIKEKYINMAIDDINYYFGEIFYLMLDQYVINSSCELDEDEEYDEKNDKLYNDLKKCIDDMLYNFINDFNTLHSNNKSAAKVILKN